MHFSSLNEIIVVFIVCGGSGENKEILIISFFSIC